MSFRNPLVRVARRAALAVLAVVLAVAAPHGGAQTPVSPATALADPFPNFDIRDYKTDPRLADVAGLAAYMDAVGKAPATADDALAAGRNGLAALRSALPGVQVHEGALGGAEVVSAMPGTPFLSGPSDDRVATLRGFLGAHEAAFGLASGQVDELVVVADQMNPAGNMAWVEFEQRINGIRVFQGLIRGAFTPRGELARTNGRLATGVGAGLSVDAGPLGRPGGGDRRRQRWTSGHRATLLERERRDDTIVFEPGADGRAPRAWLVYFPLAHGVARLAWATEVFGDPRGFLTRAGCGDGTVLFRKNLTYFQTQPATYNVYTQRQPGAGVASPALPGAGFQAPIVSRADVDADRQRGAQHVQQPRLDDRRHQRRERHTDGNNVEAGVDLVAPQRRRCRRCPARNPRLQLHLQPRAGNPPPSDRPTDARLPERRSHQHVLSGRTAIHDQTYLLGFTERARNFQTQQLRPWRRWRTTASAPRRRISPAPATPTSHAGRRHARPHADVHLDRANPRPRRRASTTTSCSTS